MELSNTLPSMRRPLVHLHLVGGRGCARAFLGVLDDHAAGRLGGRRLPSGLSTYAVPASADFFEAASMPPGQRLQLACRSRCRPPACCAPRRPRSLLHHHQFFRRQGEHVDLLAHEEMPERVQGLLVFGGGLGSLAVLAASALQAEKVKAQRWRRSR
jgi:hypothetical protein